MNEHQQQQHVIQPNDKGIGFKSVAKYALLPGIIPMVKRLAGRFGEFMHMFTMIFGAVGLIDKNHPCLRPENAGRYRFIDILGLASHNVIFDRKHIPQVVMYFAVLLAIVLCISFIIVFMLNFGLSSSQAYAQFFSEPDSSVSTYSRSTDWAFIFLQETFGKTGIGSLIWTLNDSDPGDGTSRLQAMFRAMLAHYSMALLIIAVFLVIYLMVVTLVESAVTGAPFGKKFNSVWAPIRIVIAIGLMVPVAAGYNSAQLIVFKMSDWGSNLATNVWVVGLDKMQGDKFVNPSTPDKGYRFIRALWLAEVCRAAWNKYSTDGKTSMFWTILDYIGIVGTGGPGSPLYTSSRMAERHLQSKGMLPGPDQVIPDKDEFGSNQYIVIQYGTRGTPDFCGSFRIPVEQGDVKVTDIVDGNVFVVNKFGKLISRKYGEIFETLVRDMASAADAFVEKAGHGGSCDHMLVPEMACKHKEWIIDTYWGNLGFNKALYNEECSTIKPYEAKDLSVKEAYFFQTSEADADWKLAIHDTNRGLFKMIRNGYHGGWASAGAFYMTIAYANGAVHSAINNAPTVINLPYLLENPSYLPDSPSGWKKLGGIFTSANPISGLKEEKIKEQAGEHTHNVLNDAEKWFANAPLTNNKYLRSWLGEEFQSTIHVRQRITENSDWASNHRIRPLVYDAWNSIADFDVNPLGRVVALGGYFMSLAMTLYAIGIAGSTIAGSSAFGSILTTFGTLAGLAGFALALYLPMLPFIYFTFAVIEWVMGIVEAVIGMPLWALSMITIEGDGIGKTAQGNFMRLFGIMLQPTILIIALIVSLILFSSSVAFFNKGFALFSQTYLNTAGAGGGNNMASSAAFGASMIGLISFTFLYSFAVYSIGQSCFKLITAIANGFMDWIGGAKMFSGVMDAGLAGYNKYLAMGQLEKFQSMASGGAANLGKFIRGEPKSDSKPEEKKEENEKTTAANNPSTKGAVGAGSSSGNESQIPPLYAGDPNEFRNRGKTVNSYDNVGPDGISDNPNQNDHLPETSRWDSGKIVNPQTGDVESKSRAEEARDKEFAEFAAKWGIDPNDKVAQAKFNKIMKKIGPRQAKDFMKSGHLDAFKDEDLL